MKNSETKTNATPRNPADRKRAYRIRKTAIDQRTKEDESWLASYEAMTAGNAPNAKATAVTSEAVPASSGTTESPALAQEIATTASPGPGLSPQASARPAAAPLPTAVPIAVEPTIVASLPPPPPPPRVETTSNDSQHSSRGSKDWRSKYSGKTEDGREKTCLQIAGYWHAALKAMAEQTRAAGIAPLIDPDALFPAIVLTVDEFLPERIRLEPKHVALAGSSALIVQRWMRRKDIAAWHDANGVAGDVAPHRDPMPVPVEPPASPEPEPELAVQASAVDAVAAVATAAAEAISAAVEPHHLY